MTFRRAVPALWLGASLLLTVACGNKRAANPPPPPPNYFQIAENAFQAGDFAAAVRAYNSFLQLHPSSPSGDRALFRLALAQATPGSSAYDPPGSAQALRRLLAGYPQSPLRPQAELLLRLQEEVSKLRADLGKRDERVKELARELERLKKIDMDRPPVRIPK
jgi:outer membrane protein assembly factor BamD (BamD/ComL family)